jgi:hypothetical protein
LACWSRLRHALRPRACAADGTPLRDRLFAEARKELTWRQDRRARIAQICEVRIAGDDAVGVSCPREGDEIVVAWVGRRAWLCLGVGSRDAFFSEGAQQGIDLDHGDQPLELATPEYSCELGEQERAHDYLKLAGGPHFEDLGRAPARSEQRRNVDVDVENYPAHSAAGGMLLANRDLDRLILPHGLRGGATISQNHLNPLTASQEGPIALVGKDDGLRPAVRTDHNRIGLGAASAESSQHRRQLGSRLTGWKHLIDSRTHGHSLA